MLGIRSFLLSVLAVVVIGFVSDSDFTVENGPPVEICAEVKPGITLERNVVVNFSTSDEGGPASAVGKDIFRTLLADIPC
jgi:hypothetical protein